ncbi:TonB-dependent receptor (plasmid) [Hymenobacter sp. NBH84]|uniref:TonB-dependent receptor n=1 Tax=Hymenobacter sp. NBH84 TaxID=2596915 RepID=UPI0016272CEB|nr:TonB-dependent receptor [Hymenobacter sp. NBH84]QNE42210.1 TonB-dependent receptor [Hymenobacter sp. NBH84]
MPQLLLLQLFIFTYKRLWQSNCRLAVLSCGIGMLLVSTTVRAQNETVRITVRDSLSRTPLVGASVGIPGTSTGGQTNTSGIVMLTLSPPLGVVLTVTALGYRSQQVRLSTTTVTVLLAPAAEQIAEVVVTATRTNSRLEDLPTRVEVLGEEEMREENGIKPGNIASLLGDIAGTQIQPTSPTTGNADLRIQGLQGRYSQILRDGLPLLGGYAGGFGILQIPPLDLRQIELIKGSSSTLYGGGAIAGLVNLVSRTPTLGSPHYSWTVNQSTLRESNVNGFAAARNQQLGYTMYGGFTRQQAVDVDGDGFVDVPRLLNVTVHPRLFWYPTAYSQLVVGYTGTAESRRGGDAQRLREGLAAGSNHEYFVTNLLQRHTADAIYTQDSLGGGSLTLKGTASSFSRRVRTNTVGFDARQLSYFGEANYLRRFGTQHTLVGGLSLSGERLHPDAASYTPLLNSYSYATVGVFAQDDWQVLSSLTMQAGLRLDHHNRYGSFLLPRLALLYKATEHLTFRLNGGAGYRAPVPYVNELDEREYPYVLPLTGQRAERSLGTNGDINWSHSFASGLHLTLNQGFFYTRLNHPSTLGPDSQFPLLLSWRTQVQPVISQGLETYVRMEAAETEVYLGYVFTDARRRYNPVNPHVELAARHKLAAVLVREFSAHWGAGIEASYTGQQYLNNGEQTPGYPLVAALVRYRTGPWTVVLNGENLFDYRQTRREAVVLPPLDNPVFRPLWAPVEGRVINLSVNWRFRAKS